MHSSSIAQSKHLRKALGEDILLTLPKKPQEDVYHTVRPKILVKLSKKPNLASGISAAPASGTVTSENI